MKVTRIAIATVLVALALPSAYAAGTEANVGSDQASGMTSARKWYEAGDFERQSEQGKAALDRQGFPQYAQ